MSTASLGGTSAYLSSSSASGSRASLAAAAAAAAGEEEFVVELADDEDLTAAILDELDDRAAADDEHLWLAYEAAAHLAGEAADTSFAPSPTGSRPASAVSLSAAKAMRALLPTPPPAQGPYVLPATSRTPLTATQQTIASELAVLDLGGSESARGQARAVGLRTEAKFALIHPLWIAHGKARCEAEQRALAEQLANPVIPLAEDPITPTAAALSAQQPSTTPPSRRSTQVSRASSRSGSRDDTALAAAVTMAGKKGGLGATLPLAVEAAPPPRERTFALGASLVALRESRTQESLQEARRIPLSRVPAVGLMPDSEHWHVLLERQLDRIGEPADGATVSACSLTCATHSLTVRTLRTPASGGVGARTTSYSFDGQRYRQLFAESGSSTGGGSIGVLEDLAKADALVWARASEWLSRDLLAPLGLPPGREGWLLFWQEYVPFEACAVHLPDLRTIADGELALEQLKKMPPPPPAQSPAQTRPLTGATPRSR